MVVSQILVFSIYLTIFSNFTFAFTILISSLSSPVFSLSGLAELAGRKYKSAARNFLQASFDNCECPEVGN